MANSVNWIRMDYRQEVVTIRENGEREREKEREKKISFLIITFAISIF